MKIRRSIWNETAKLQLHLIIKPILDDLPAKVQVDFEKELINRSFHGFWGKLPALLQVEPGLYLFLPNLPALLQVDCRKSQEPH